MQITLMLLHIIICLALIIIVLLQGGRGAEIGAVFGSSSQTLFGTPTGTTFMDRVTTVTAIIFMVSCLVLTYLSARPHTKSLMENVKTSTQPAIPSAKPVPTELPVKPKSVPEKTKQAPAPPISSSKETSSKKRHIPASPPMQ